MTKQELEFSRNMIENFIRQLDFAEGSCESKERREAGADQPKTAPIVKSKYQFKLDGECEDIFTANVEQVLEEQEKLKKFRFKGLINTLREKNVNNTKEEREYWEKLTAKLLER